MKEIKFIMKEMFPPDEPLAIWILTLSRIYNDLKHVNSYMVNIYESESYSESEMIYFARLGFAHYREAVKFIDSYKDKSEIRDFVNNPDKEIIEKYDFVIASGNHFNDSFLKKYLVLIRNNIFHYFDDCIKEIINSKVGYESTVRIIDKAMKDIDLVFADEMSVFLSFKSMETDDFTNLVKEISSYILALIDFLNDAIATYFEQNINKTKITDYPGKTN